MKILIVSENFYPDTFAINDTVRILTERGHQVMVLTGLPDYTTGEIPEEYRHGKKRRQRFHGADVIRLATLPRKKGILNRALNYLSFVVSGNRFARFYDVPDFDVIFVWQVSPLTMAIPAILLKRRFKKPIFLYCMDIWPECIKAMGFREGTPFYLMASRLSRWIYQQCDHIAVSSQPFFEYLERVNGYDRSRMSYLPQYAPEDMLVEDFTKMPDDRVDFLYVGNIGKSQNLDCLMRAISLINVKKQVMFHIIGGGSSFDEIKKMASDLGITNCVAFYGPKKYEESKSYYRKVDACVLTLDGSNRIGDTLPGKLQTYMAAGKPVFGALNGAGYHVINESNAGGCVNAGDSQGLADLLSDFVAHPEKYKRAGVYARNYCKAFFSERRHVESLETVLRELHG